MKAVLHKEFGGPEVLEVSNNVEMPKIDKDEVLIKVHAAGINRPDILQRSGGYPPPPGVSTILKRILFQTTEVAFANIVIPRSRSRSLLSKARSTVASFSLKAPDCFSNSSTNVVFP